MLNFNGKGQSLYRKAKELIPGGTMLLSKRPEMFLPEFWPSYYKKAKDVNIWDLDNNKYLDMSIMGIGTCSLGYANKHVNKAVKSSVGEGSFSTLNCIEEVALAEKLIELHPFADMARFARTGGEATSIAIRIARASAGKSDVAMCGYHSWHDWYLAANLKSSQNLDSQLLPGLKTVGLPKQLSGSTIPFNYGDIGAFKKIVEKNKDLGVVITEVQRGRNIDLKFLRELRKITKNLGIVLIFDEISSGFRLNIGGISNLYEISPDMICLGKALGNGFGISAVLGVKEVMEAAQESFISSTYWSERTGYVAALETINQFQNLNVIDYLIDIGNVYEDCLKEVINSINIDITPGGLLTIPSLIINNKQSKVIKTYITQEMLKNGYLASNVTYLSFKHSVEIINKYFDILSTILGKLDNELSKGNDIEYLIDGELCHSGFKRLAKF